MNLVQMIDFSDLSRIAVVFTDGTGGQADEVWTYGELLECITSVRRLLDERAISLGSTVGIAARNHPLNIAAFLGVIAAGRVACPLNTKLRAGVGQQTAAKVGLTFAFSDEAGLEFLPPDIPYSRLDAILNTSQGSSTARGEFVNVRDDAVACILFTSGSTSAPKAVQITHRGYRWAVSSYDFLNDKQDVPSEQLRALVAAPLFHMNAQYCTLLYLHFGGSIVLMSQFDPRAYLRSIEVHRVTEVTGVPSMIAMADEVRSHGKTFPSVQYVSNGSAPLTPSIEASIKEMFPNAVYDNGYGTTETGPVSFGPHPDGIARPPGSLGYPMPGVEVRLTEQENGGVLWLRTPMTCTGYMGGHGVEKFSDGWYRTGDVVRRDASGFFYFVGREDDLIVVGGEKVAPSEIEKILERHGTVRSAAVVGVTDELRGQIPVAFVVLERSAKSVTENELQVYVEKLAPRFACPRRVFFVDAIPVTALGKMPRRALREDAELRMRLEKQ